MNRNVGTNPNRMLGATISADNRTYGLAPARPAGRFFLNGGPDFSVLAQPETVAEIADPYCLTVITTGDFTVLRFADAVENADRLIQRAARLVAVGDVVFLGGAWREVTRVRRQGFSLLWDFADGKNAIRSAEEVVTVARTAPAEAVAR